MLVLKHEHDLIAQHLAETTPQIAMLQLSHITQHRAVALVEQALLERGKPIGTVRGWERYGLQFDKPIGYRIDITGKRIPLSYGELKLNPKTGLYHVIPRSGPAS